MKISQLALEHKILKNIIDDDKAMDIVNERGITDNHFIVKAPGTSVSITGRLFRVCQEYYRDSGGFRVTEDILSNILIQKNVSKEAINKILGVWYDILEEETDINEVPYLAQLLKDRYCVQLQSEMIDKITPLVENDQVQESIETMNTYLNIMYEERDDEKNQKKYFDMSDAKNFFLQEYDERVINQEYYRGVYCGLSQIDSQTFGFQPAQLITVLGPTSGGKSVLLLNWAHYAHTVCRKNVLYFSFEMTEWLCKIRHASLIGEVPFYHIKGLTLTAEERESLTRGFNENYNGKYFRYVEAIHDPTPEFIEQTIKAYINDKNIENPDIIFVDYVGNMTTRGTSKQAKPWEKNGDASEGLFILAKKYDLPFVTAQQINRESIKENRKRKEDGKAQAFYQDAASGDQRLMHLSTYVIGMEPNRDECVCWLHPVKMRDAWFKPFAVKWLPDFNKIMELSPSQQEALNTVKTADLDNGFTKIRDYVPPTEEIVADLSSWASGIDDF